jgi:uncharacterized protein with LGFP repeats
MLGRYFTKISLVILTILLGVTFALPQKTQALSGSQWKPGRIIDDAVFFNKDSMSVSQIQSFLNSKVPNCSGGYTFTIKFPVGYNTSSAHDLYQTHKPAFTCLKNYYENPNLTYTKKYTFKNKTGNNVTINRIHSVNSAYWVSNYTVSYVNGDYRKGANIKVTYNPKNGTKPSGGISAAKIIWDAAQKYNINPQVLIVMLEKETSIVTDSWSAGWQYDRAMGYGCPDSGPGGTANCDSKYYGFYNQVNNAAWQLRRYVTYPGEYNFRSGVTRYIQYHPNISCGGKNIYIENSATAALYNYTPYQPNQAALNNLYGTGNDCSAYGNRNFWRMFNDWFGSTRYTTKGAIGAKYSSYGGIGALGLPQMNEWCSLPQNGCYQKFDNGSIYWTKKTGAWVVRAAMRTTWGSVGSVKSYLGYPVSDEKSATDGIYQEFQGGRIYWSNSTGTNIVHGGIKSRYLSLNETSGYLGFPTGNEIKNGNGVFQQFEGGRIYWSKGSGAWNTRGGIQTKYISIGGGSSPLGFPLGEETSTTGGVFQQFQGGRIYWNSSLGANSIYGAIGARFTQITDAIDKLGYPTNDEQLIPGGAYQEFENGNIYWSKGSGAWELSGELLNEYLLIGEASGSLGYPISSQKILSDGVYQTFKNGRIYIRTGDDSRIVRGAILMRYRINGGQPALGYPVSQETLVNGGVMQQFENGNIYWSNLTGAHIVKNELLNKYIAAGSVFGALGYPISPERSFSNGIYQIYQGGHIYYSASTGAYVIRGGILGKFLSLYTDQNRLGLPTADESTHPILGIYQTFQGGEVAWDGTASLSYY